VTASLGLVLVVGLDFFPSVEAGMLRLHFRAPAGTRIVDAFEHRIRDVIPADEVRSSTTTSACRERSSRRTFGTGSGRAQPSAEHLRRQRSRRRKKIDHAVTSRITARKNATAAFFGESRNAAFSA
jgi:hypothetical protein